MTTRWCKRCVLPSTAATPLTFDEEGICSGCRVFEQSQTIDWAKRQRMLKELFNEHRSDGSNYDCIIPVSGGKDSYFQTHVVTQVFGLKPLLVTYHGNNYLPEAEGNLRRMREVFDVDHIIFRPSKDLLVKMNYVGFTKTGDMNWHNHCGIFTFPVQIAVKFNVPLIVWGEHGFLDLGGMFSLNDLVEMTEKHRTEHGLHGYDWDDFIDEELGIRSQDLLWAKYPSDVELERVSVRGIYLGNYMPWNGNRNSEIAKQYNWEEARQPFDRTYRRISNLDDMHENGIHDYMKYIKFGYGRGTDHATKDIRLGKITRDQGIEYVCKYDDVKPRDLQRWLEYVNMTEGEFDETADTFRDPLAWWKDDNGDWERHDILDDEKVREVKETRRLRSNNRN